MGVQHPFHLKEAGLPCDHGSPLSSQRNSSGSSIAYRHQPAELYSSVTSALRAGKSNHLYYLPGLNGSFPGAGGQVSTWKAILAISTVFSAALMKSRCGVWLFLKSGHLLTSLPVALRCGFQQHLWKPSLKSVCWSLCPYLFMHCSDLSKTWLKGNILWWGKLLDSSCQISLFFSQSRKLTWQAEGWLSACVFTPCWLHLWCHTGFCAFTPRLRGPEEFCNFSEFPFHFKTLMRKVVFTENCFEKQP